MRLLFGLFLLCSTLIAPAIARAADCRDTSLEIKDNLSVFKERGDTAREVATLRSAADAEEACAEQQPASAPNVRAGYRYYAAMDYSRAADLLRKSDASWLEIVPLYESSTKLWKALLQDPWIRESDLRPVSPAIARAEIAVNDDYIHDVMPVNDGVLKDPSGQVSVFSWVPDCRGDANASRRLFTVASGTRVSLNSHLACHPIGPDSYDVTILDGPQRGRDGIVFEKSLVRIRPKGAK